MEDHQETIQKNWLQRLKDESWEAEILVSAVAIFAILNSFSLLDWLIITFIDFLDPNQYFVGYFIIVCGYLAIGILASMFSIHFALRAYWIGLVGLNSVFPDYGLEDSAYSPLYTKKILKVLPKISKSTSKIDELCSVIFSAAFAFMLIFLYITISASLYLLLFNLLKGMLPTWLLLIPLAPLVLILIFGMIISIPANMKKFRNNETIQHSYFLYAKWGSLLLYGPIYKSVLQISMLFGSNFKKKKGLVKMVGFMLLIGFVFGGVKMLNSDFRYLLTHSREFDQSRIYDYHYAANTKEANFLLAPEIQSEIITGKTIKLFVPILNHETKIISEICELNKEAITFDDKLERQKNWQANLDCYASKLRIHLDDQIIAVDFLKTDHPQTQQFGLSGFIPLADLPDGLHRLKITKEVSSEIEKNWEIPFYFSPN